LPAGIESPFAVNGPVERPPCRKARHE